MPLDSAGYITDVPYVWTFIPDLAPAWLDHVATVSGFAPRPAIRILPGAILVAGKG